MEDKVITLVNMIPNDHSGMGLDDREGEISQDSEPSLAVDAANPLQIAGTAFTPGAAGGNAPIYVSVDGGMTWMLNPIIPAPGGSASTFDQTLRFAGAGNNLYASTIRDDSPVPFGTIVNFLRSNNFTNAAIMTELDHRSGLDQPFIQAATVMGGPDAGKDRVYVGSNDFGAPGGRTATLDVFLDAANSSVHSTIRLEARGTGTAGQDGPQVRPAIHADGTVYAAFYGWRAFDGGTQLVTSDIVVVRDDNWGAGANPFTALADGGDGLNGMRVVRGIQFTWDEVMGQERTGGDLSIAVDPNDSATVYLVWADHPAGGYTIHVCRSTDRGVTWSEDLLTIVNATCPALAINDDGHVGLLYEQLTGPAGGQCWETHLQRSLDGVTWHDLLLATPRADTPVAAFDPYLGDYQYLMAVGTDFYGIFCANNTPDLANFPQGVTYQRNHNFGTMTLLDIDNVTPVNPSIDPFFVKVARDTPAITWNPMNLVYGTPLSADPLTGQLNATAPVPGTFTYNHAVGECLNAGTYTLNVTFTPDDPLNFNPASATRPLTVSKAPPPLDWNPPPPIDQTDPLPASAYPSALPLWSVCGTTVTVAGSYQFVPAPGLPLSVGLHTLTTIFTPVDTANYTTVTETQPIQVLNGYPIVMSASFAPVVIPLDIAHPVVNVTVTVKNDSVRPHVTQDPAPGFEYSEGDTFQTKGFPSVAGAYRIGVDLQETTYAVAFPYRWGFGKTLAPGESVQLSGTIRFHNKDHNGHYYVGMLQEPAAVLQDHQGTTLITVVDSFLP